MSKYSQGICGDGAAILEDGRMMTVDEIVARLNELQEECDWRRAQMIEDGEIS